MASLIPILPFMFLLFTTFYHFGEARTIAVGGSSDAWKVPESPNTLNHWAGTVRFHVGDTLLFKYDSKVDSVLQVTKENYESCKTEKHLKEYKDGDTKVHLNVSGPYFFISGANGNCGKGEKVSIVVQSTHHKPGPVSTPPTPSPKPSTTPTTPAVPKNPAAPAPAPNTAVGLVAGNGIFWASVLAAIIGLVFV
ncbi:Early nodulin-like protein 11 [Cardamine amara subsp. amara]|uniref:Early nodulin-like protein 11 n=1 Tax=Cardamine amara subsp. amara TaxID=228776 RepID=A0ABD1BWT5_CARAN